MVDELTTPEPAGAAVPRRGRTHRVIVILVPILLVLSAGTIGYLAFLNHTVTTNIRHAALLPTPTAGESVPARNPAARDAQNILLIGSDSRGSLASGRSDVIVLVHISRGGKQVYLIHF